MSEIPQEKSSQAAISCQSCAFYREIPLIGGKKRKLCMLTGEKKPMAGMRFCHFIAGKWNDIDRILGLPKSKLSGNTGDPNTTKLGSGFSSNGRKFAKKDSFTPDDLSVNPISHIPGKGSLARPGIREAPVARSARERA